jgi:5'-nucleotidase
MKPLIFVTNDDGITAKGISSLIEVAKEFGDVVVVAPDKPQSGMGHAITVNHPLRLTEVDLFSGVEAYTCSGTPVDCVKLGIYEVLKRRPDLILSGINHGENTSTNVLYSGTMSAAVEGAMESIPSIGFSLKNFDAQADFTSAQVVARAVIKHVLDHGMPLHVCYNVNVPDVRPDQLKGVKWCKQAHAFWADRFDKRHDQFGRPYYWLTGEFSSPERIEGTDLEAMDMGYASIVPTQFDMTSYSSLESTQHVEL